jgi:PKD repeat protein
VWYKDNSNNIPQPSVSTSYVVSSFGTYYAVVSNVFGCSFKTNSVTFSQSLSDPLPTCPNTFNPLLSLTNTCGVVVARITNVGNPLNFNWSSSNGASPTVTPNPPTNIFARFVFTDPKIYTISYSATYNNNGVICIVKRAATITVPYIADLKYTVSCGTGANYLVKLIDNSKFYFETPINLRRYIVRNMDTNIDRILTADEITNGIALPFGNYRARLEISKTNAPAYPMCSKEVLFTLDPKPTVAFTMSSTSVCPGEPVQLTLTTPVNPNWTYLWTFVPFPNLITNTQPQPYVTYAGGGPYQVSLKVTNQYGCTVTTQPQQITVKQATELTKLNVPNVIKCSGETASLLFPTIGISPLPVSYKWMKGNAPAPGMNTTNPYIATESGSYWLQTAPSSGCFKTVKSFYANVAFVDIPNPVINSMPEVCIDQGVRLSKQYQRPYLSKYMEA